MEMDEDVLVSVNEAAKRLGGISPWTIHSWLSKGRLQRTKVGSRTMIRASELQKVIEDGGKSPAPQQKSPHKERQDGRETTARPRDFLRRQRRELRTCNCLHAGQK